MFSYSVAIRTLGKAGEKYLTTLKSVASQTVPPTSINVYIPNGYDLPKETIGKEKYYRCNKGMIAQRALQYEEIKDEWILFLDDDMYLPQDIMERAQDFINSNSVDALSANVFLNHKASNKNKITAAFNSVFPMKSNYWGFKVTRSGRYKYNNQILCILRLDPGLLYYARKTFFFLYILKMKSGWINLVMHLEKIS